MGDPSVVGLWAVVFVFGAPVAAVLLLRTLGKRQPAASAPVMGRADPQGLKAGVYGLKSGTTYRVIRPITDYYKNEFATGDLLTYVQRHFLPYDGGHTVVFKPRTMYLQEQANADVLDALDQYLEIVPTPPPAPPSMKPLRVWQDKYSSCEMIYLELYPDMVRLELNGGSITEERWSHEEVLAGQADRSIRGGFAEAVIEELKAAIRAL